MNNLGILFGFDVVKSHSGYTVFTKLNCSWFLENLHMFAITEPPQRQVLAAEITVVI